MILSQREAIAEMLCVLSWSEEARLAYVAALESWRRAGCPPVPLGATNYRDTFQGAGRGRRHRRGPKS